MAVECLCIEEKAVGWLHNNGTKWGVKTLLSLIIMFIFIINNNILLLWQWIHGNEKKCFSTELRFCVKKRYINIWQLNANDAINQDLNFVQRNGY